MTHDPKFMFDCFLCQRPFRFGPHRYEGRAIGPWKIRACDRCIDQNWDGLVPSQHPRLLEHLESIGVPIKLNEDGWLSIPPRGA
ncbi:hypothetical protein E4M02_02525 [Brevundimonas sp. S30B]|uniref:hypothetical protein n=1 Tax=unclassified Brevundimonas TaxID=2622653 RepID=UPI0010718EB3|nr:MULTISPECIES: hypothetical protein [unclassified Brevundimonas]QBX37234.1 hypothetical protein E4M01_05295 [Brevundimonas sp. MF30-B]TFW03973.1 hypothetical protein E4M02_02525 [Brevundimonas sp. S30B]